MSDLYTWGDEITAEDGPAPFTQVPDWLLLSGCSAQAFRMYVFLAAHIDPRDPTARNPCPKQTAIAKALGLSNWRQVGPYGRELERLGALRMEKYRYQSGMRNGYRYRLRFNPPLNYRGAVRMKDFYEAHPEVRFDTAPGRLKGSLTSPDTSPNGGTKNSTSEGTEFSTPQGPTGSTSRGTTGSTPQGTTRSTLEGPTGGTLQGALDRSAEEDQWEADQWEAEKPPPPPSVPVAEDARAELQKGPAAPDDLSPDRAGGTAGASPTDGPAGVKSASTQARLVEPKFGAMARDIIRTLPHVLQPATEDERDVIGWLIADKLAQGYPVPVVRQVLTVDPPEHVKVKTAFVGHRLDHMAPWIPPARPALDTAAVDELRERETVRADDDRQRERAAEARAAMAAARGRKRGQPQQQEEDEGAAGS